MHCIISAWRHWGCICHLADVTPAPIFFTDALETNVRKQWIRQAGREKLAHGRFRTEQSLFPRSKVQPYHSHCQHLDNMINTLYIAVIEMRHFNSKSWVTFQGENITEWTIILCICMNSPLIITREKKSILLIPFFSYVLCHYD